MTSSFSWLVVHIITSLIAFSPGLHSHPVPALGCVVNGNCCLWCCCILVRERYSGLDSVVITRTPRHHHQRRLRNRSLYLSALRCLIKDVWCLSMDGHQAIRNEFTSSPLQSTIRLDFLSGSFSLFIAVRITYTAAGGGSRKLIDAEVLGGSAGNGCLQVCPTTDEGDFWGIDVITRWLYPHSSQRNRQTRDKADLPSLSYYNII